MSSVFSIGELYVLSAGTVFEILSVRTKGKAVAKTGILVEPVGCFEVYSEFQIWIGCFHERHIRIIVLMIRQDDPETELFGKCQELWEQMDFQYLRYDLCIR